MDREEKASLSRTEAGSSRAGAPRGGISRRQALKYGLVGVGGLMAGGYLTRYLLRPTEAAAAPRVFRNGAPSGELWEAWKERGWVREARHYLKLGSNVQCKVCPHKCLLAPDDRSRCRNKVNKDGKLYTLAYGNPCSMHVDPVEKKPLFHFLPGQGTFSIATSGCGFRCLNCQNWDISQRKPEETKDPRGNEVRITPDNIRRLSRRDVERGSMFPEDVVAMSEHLKCTSISYTYSEPTAFYEYMYDTAKLARSKGLKNVWVTCGYITPEALGDLAQYLDAANVDLKSFSDEIYEKLNSGRLQPILDTLKLLKQRGVWFEVTNLVVPTYTDQLDMIAKMCDWLVENIGPDYPLHFSRFHPAHRLTHLPATPAKVLTDARSVALKAGLRYVYIGNIRGIKDSQTTFCPSCGKAVIERRIYTVAAVHVNEGKCEYCGARIAGVWKT